MARKDNKGRNLKTGEYQRPDGRYEYRYKDEITGKRNSVYAADLASLREMEKKINKDMDDLLITDASVKKLTFIPLYSILPECCPIIQYINSCNVCLFVGFDFDTLKSHIVSEVRKSPSPASTVFVYPVGSKVKPSLIIGPYLFQNAMLLSTIIRIFLMVSKSGFVSEAVFANNAPVGFLNQTSKVTILQAFIIELSSNPLIWQRYSLASLVTSLGPKRLANSAPIHDIEKASSSLVPITKRVK